MKVLLISLTVFFFCCELLAYDVGLSWDIPTEREDGTALPLSEIKEYNLYFGSNPQNLTTKTPVGNTVKAFIVKNIPFGTQYYFRISTTDSDGVEGRKSDAVTIEKPPTPSNFRIIITLRDYILDQKSLVNSSAYEKELGLDGQLSIILKRLDQTLAGEEISDGELNTLIALVRKDMGDIEHLSDNDIVKLVIADIIDYTMLTEVKL